MNIFLFSVDLEDIRLRIKDGLNYRERLPVLTQQYLNFLNIHNVKCTFFIVGDVAEKYPDLIREIYHKGHEVACHSAKHIPLDKMKKETFRDDLKKNIEALRKAGVTECYGYRAPIFSLTEKTKWAYEILEEFGFKYSSSVLPAKSPLYGWKEFGNRAKKFGNITEIPINIGSFLGKKIPFSGGIYFRVLPWIIVKNLFLKTFKRKEIVCGYFHPYDIDTEQEHFMHPDIGENRFYNFLMYYNRENVFHRLEKVMQHCTIIPFFEYVKRLN